MATEKVAAQPSLWNRNYLFTIAVNLLVYSVHFLLMRWSISVPA